MVKQRLVILALVLMLALAGCCSNPPEADLLREHRRHLIESIRPALVDALDRAKKPDGSPLYIDPYRDEKVNLLDTIIQSSARVAPSEEDGGVYQPALPPWRSR
jgi:hypothetical protein